VRLPRSGWVDHGVVLAAEGKNIDHVTAGDLAAVDSFHTCGSEATAELVGQLGLATDLNVLDIGCGIGGATRLVAERRGCRVSGINLTGDYINVVRALSWRNSERNPSKKPPICKVGLSLSRRAPC
jgi:SAM-dependent methyltransferase